MRNPMPPARRPDGRSCRGSDRRGRRAMPTPPHPDPPSDATRRRQRDGRHPPWPRAGRQPQPTRSVNRVRRTSSVGGHTPRVRRRRDRDATATRRSGSDALPAVRTPWPRRRSPSRCRGRLVPSMSRTARRSRATLVVSTAALAWSRAAVPHRKSTRTKRQKGSGGASLPPRSTTRNSPLTAQWCTAASKSRRRSSIVDVEAASGAPRLPRRPRAPGGRQPSPHRPHYVSSWARRHREAADAGMASDARR